MGNFCKAMKAKDNYDYCVVAAHLQMGWQAASAKPSQLAGHPGEGSDVLQDGEVMTGFQPLHRVLIFFYESVIVAYLGVVAKHRSTKCVAAKLGTPLHIW